MTWNLGPALNLVARLRGCSGPAWHRLTSPEVTARAAAARADRAVDAGFLEKRRVDGRLVYCVTDKGIRTHAPSVPRAWASPNLHTARFAFWRSELWRCLTDAGYSLGHDAVALYRIRRLLLDGIEGPAEDLARKKRTLRRSEKLELLYAVSCVCGFAGIFDGTKTCSRCSKALNAPRLVPSPGFCALCNAVTESHGQLHVRPEGGLCPARSVASPTYLPFDVAHKKGADILVVPDQPYRAVRRQIEALPLDIVPGQPKLDVCWFPTDGTYSIDECRFSPSKRLSEATSLLRLAQSSRRRAEQGIRPQNTHLLDWRPVPVPVSLERQLVDKHPAAIRALIAKGLRRLGAGVPPPKPKGATVNCLVDFDGDFADSLSKARGRFSPNSHLRVFIAACIEVALAQVGSVTATQEMTL